MQQPPDSFEVSDTTELIPTSRTCSSSLWKRHIVSARCKFWRRKEKGVYLFRGGDGGTLFSGGRAVWCDYLKRWRWRNVLDGSTFSACRDRLSTSIYFKWHSVEMCLNFYKVNLEPPKNHFFSIVKQRVPLPSFNIFVISPLPLLDIKYIIDSS